MAFTHNVDGIIYCDHRRPIINIVSCFRMKNNPEYPMFKYWQPQRQGSYDLFIVAEVQDKRFKEKKRYQTMKIWKNTRIRSLGINKMVAMDWGFCPETNLLPCRDNNIEIAEEFLIRHSLKIKLGNEPMYLEAEKISHEYIELENAYV